MEVKTIVQEINRLPLNKKFFVVEETIKSIKKEETNKQLEIAADALYSDYMNYKELTAFTALDFKGLKNYFRHQPNNFTI